MGDAGWGHRFNLVNVFFCLNTKTCEARTVCFLSEGKLFIHWLGGSINPWIGLLCCSSFHPLFSPMCRFSMQRGRYQSRVRVISSAKTPSLLPDTFSVIYRRFDLSCLVFTPMLLTIYCAASGCMKKEVHYNCRSSELLRLVNG